MKQIILILAAFFFVLENSDAQDSLHSISPSASVERAKTHSPLKYSAEFYMNKSRKLNTAAWVLLGLGSVIGIAGYIGFENQLHTEYLGFDNIGNSYAAGFAMIAGTVMVGISIPMFIRSAHYKKMGLDMSATLKFETGPELNQTGMIRKHFPAVGISIRL